MNTWDTRSKWNNIFKFYQVNILKLETDTQSKLHCFEGKKDFFFSPWIVMNSESLLVYVSNKGYWRIYFTNPK